MQGDRGGPKTAKGKRTVSRNALKPCPERPLKRRGSRRDGLRSDAPVIPELESFDEWDRHRAGTVASFAPEGLEARLPSALERAFRGQLQANQSGPKW